MQLFLSLLSVLLSRPAMGSASYPDPSVPIAGTPHRIILSGYLEHGIFRDAPESGNGYCVRQGERHYSGAYSSLAYRGPYVLLAADGRVLKRFDDSPGNRGRFWTAERLDCE